MADDFEKRHLANLRNREAALRKIYEGAIQRIVLSINTISFNGEQFRIKDFPALNNRIQSIIKGLHVDIYSAAVNGIEASWDLSNEKNNILVDKRLAGKKPSVEGKKILYDPNLEALKQFIKRKEKGLNLSERVGNSLDTYKTEMETALGVGISEGRSAIEMARDLKSYLNEPDRLFRKVKQDDGSLKLSNAARNFHPGQGVYRSSFQNALRVTASETNMAYRSADWERWQNLPFVIGIEVHLSKNHPEYDICDSLKGVYPKRFYFRGWHPRCICFQTPVMITDVDYDRFEDAILDGKDPEEIKQISNTPVGFRNYVEQNLDRIEGWNNKPYWFVDNKEFLPGKASMQEGSTSQPKETKSDTKKPSYDLDVLMNEKNESFGWYMKNTQDRVKKIQEQYPQLKPEEVVALDMYSNTSYRPINRYLRNREKFDPSPYDDNFEKVLNSALDKLDDFKGTVYRGGNFDAITLEKYKNAFDKGVPITENGFTSTSKETGLAFDGDTFIIIESKTGKSIEEIVEFDVEGAREAEVLFRSGTKFKITEMRREIHTDKFTGKKRKRTLIRMQQL
jgi:hypothetical protein